MRFEVSERIDTLRTREQILATLEEQFRKVAGAVERDGDTIVAYSIEPTFGSINRADTTTVSIREAEGGFLLLAEVHYRPSVAFWIILPLTCCSAFMWIIPIGMYLYQRKLVRAAIAECFERVRNEHAAGRALLPRSAPAPPMPASLTPPSPKPSVPAAQLTTEEMREMESFAQTQLYPQSARPAEAPTPIVEWYYSREGQRVGPFGESELVAMLSREELPPDTMVWQTGWVEWRPIAQTELIRNASAPPPLVGEAVSNTWVWVLAFAPVLGAFAEGFVSVLFAISIGYLWWITVLLNIVLATLDERKLQLAGHDTGRMGAAWIIPVYLFKRAKVLRQNNAYFIVWCVLFGLILIGVL